MKDLFQELDDLFGLFEAEGLNKVERNKSKYSVPSFPPCNVIIGDDGSMNFEFALVGYSKEDLGIDYKNNSLILYTTKEFEKKEEPTTNYLVKGIKTPSFNYAYLVPEAKFDIQKLEAVFNNGMLKINIPMKKQQEKPKTVFTIK